MISTELVDLSRLQFAATAMYHYLFVPLTLGLSMLLVAMEACYVVTGKQVYKDMVKFWGKLFGINFALGVTTGITMEFQFGTNWSYYSHYVGDIFGAPLAIEGLMAFFLESTFIGLFFFGWSRLKKGTHLLCTFLMALGSNLSALWILVANGWMQNPVGYVIKNGRAELSSFFDVVTNPFAWSQYFHTIFAAWMLGGFFVLGVSSWHLLRKNELDLFKRSVRIAAPFTLILVLLLGLQGHHHAQIVAEMQPAKLAAMESHWETGTHVPMYLLTWPDQANRTNSIQALPIPSLLSLLAFNSPSAEVKGLDAFPADDIPPVLPTFLSFRFMVACAGLFVLLAIAAWWWRKDLENHPLLMKALIYVIPLPYLGIMAGWAVAEIGRQPWIVYGLMRTSDAVSPVPTSSVGLSLAAFIVIYTFLGILDIYLLRKYAKKGPEAAPEAQA